MAGRIGAGISLSGLFPEDFQYGVYLSGTVTASDVGKAVTLDTTKANTFKLAGDGDPVHGRLETVENRVQEGIVVGTISFHGALKFPVKSGQTVNIGDTVVGAGSGEVKALAVTKDTDGTGSPDIKLASHNFRNLVVERPTGYAVVLF